MKFIQELLLLENFDQPDWKELWEDSTNLTRGDKRQPEGEPENYRRLLKTVGRVDLWYWTVDYATGLAALHSDPEIQKKLMRKAGGEEGMLETFVCNVSDAGYYYFLGPKYQIIHRNWRVQNIEQGAWHDLFDMQDKLDGSHAEKDDIMNYMNKIAMLGT
jgi:hypothetical protein